MCRKYHVLDSPSMNSFRFLWFMIRVTFGEHDRCDEKVRPETRFVLRAFVQDFSFTNFDKDIAILRLNDRVPITDFIRPICLPTGQGECNIVACDLETALCLLLRLALLKYLIKLSKMQIFGHYTKLTAFL